MNQFRLPTEVCIEPGCLGQLTEIVRARGAKSVLLVTDSHLAELDFVGTSTRDLEAAGIQCVLFQDVESNPRTTTAQRIGLLAREETADLVVGIGGGSVLDAAKAGAMLATNGGQLLDYVGKDLFEEAPLPYIAVPTTCGTGSEVTWVSVITSEERSTKVSVKGLGMFPDVALVDADLIAKLPAPLLASTSMDALTHAIEACTGRLANPTSDALANAAVERIFAFLPWAVAESAKAALEEVACASTLAGMAFGNSDVGAVHCLSETLGGLFDVPHGLANAILLAPVQRYQLESCSSVFARLEARISGQELSASSATQFLHRIEALAQDIGIPSFTSLKIPRDAFAEIARRSVENGSNSSCPQPMRAEDYIRILERLD